jgi:alkyl hydroperoxide reductase subunit AhpF
MPHQISPCQAKREVIAMALLDEKIQEQVKQQLEGLEGPVKLVVFTQEVECEYCRENTTLAQEVAGLSDQIEVEVHDFVQDDEVAQRYNVDKIPAIVVEGKEDYGVRFYGVPFGYEFASLLEAIRSVSAGDSELAPESRAMLAGLKEALHLQVFITLT